MKYLLISFLIILITIISGCIGETSIPMTSTKDGVVITDFSFEHSPVYANDNVGLSLEIQNVGGNKAELKKIQIYGVDFTASKSTDREWGVKGDELQELNEGFIKTNLPSKGELFQPDPDINLEGAKDYYEWRLQAPSGVTSETNYDFQVRVEYAYNTTYSGTIRIIDDTYLQSLKEEEKQELFNTGGIASSKLTNGPISITPYSGRHFIVDVPNPESRPMKFKIENVGSGFPYINESTKYYIKITDIAGIYCPEEEIKLSSGKSYTIDCLFSPPGTNDFTNKIDKPFQITFNYNYYIDGSTSITVKPVY